MYYYKIYYNNDSYLHYASKKAIRNKKQMGDTCTQVELKSCFQYLKEIFLKNFKKCLTFHQKYDIL